MESTGICTRMGTLKQRNKWGEYMGVVVSGRLNRGGKDMYPQIINQVILWALGELTIRGMSTGKQK